MSALEWTVAALSQQVGAQSQALAAQAYALEVTQAERGALSLEVADLFWEVQALRGEAEEE